MSVDRIRELRREARRLNAKAKKAAADAGGGWVPMNAESEADFRRYLDIQVEIARLKDQARK